MTTARLVHQIANQDRYLKCQSCRSMADCVFVPAGVTVTRVVGHVSRGWAEPELIVRGAEFTTCARHFALNLRRAHAAESTFVVPSSAPEHVKAWAADRKAELDTS